ncbi:MAG: glycosyltransferase [Gammaproteobacteria bacterium]|nr:glycosyltransferase [Gammaproteobacteria bacterium]
MQFPNARILIFAKAPEAGKVKTRLIPALTPDEAAALYQQLLTDTVVKMMESRVAAVDCWCAPDGEHPLFQRLSHRFGIELFIQQGADLGERMAHAANEALVQHEAVVLIGGDCPGLMSDQLQQAFTWLYQGDDAVIAPAEDGGYVLLGLRRVDHRLFKSIPWGGDQVLNLTRERLKSLDWRWRELKTQWDLDRPEDLKRYLRGR